MKLVIYNRCGFLSSVSDWECDLPEGHPCHSPTRFHRFAPPPPSFYSYVEALGRALGGEPSE